MMEQAELRKRGAQELANMNRGGVAAINQGLNRQAREEHANAMRDRAERERLAAEKDKVLKNAKRPEGASPPRNLGPPNIRSLIRTVESRYR